MPDINGIPYVESDDLVSAYPAVSQSLAQEISDQLASKLPYSYGTATPTTTDSGFLWYDSNSTPPVPKYWNGSAFATLAPAPGLELITSQPISGSSSISVNGCFTSDYENYLIKVNLTTATSNEVAMRLRASGTDTTTNYRGTYLRVPEGTGGPTTANHGTDRLEPGYVDTGAKSAMQIQLFGPNAADDTMAISVGANYANDTRYTQAFQTDSTAFDGFTLYSTGGALMTGTIRVYGYKD